MPVNAFSNPNLSRSAMPAVTTTDAISIADRANNFRPIEWLDQYGDIAWLNRIDSQMLRALEAIGFSQPINQPKYEWIEASRLHTQSLLETAISDTATVYIKLEDPGICNVGMFIYTPGGEWMEVEEMSLTNGLSGGTNVKVVRGAGGTVATTHAAGVTFISAAQVMGELDVPRDGVGTMPGLSQYNFAMVFSDAFSASRAANKTTVIGNWGSIDKERMFSQAATRVRVGQYLYFGPRYFENLGSRGPRYFTGGFTNFIKSNVLSLDTEPSRHTPESIDQFLQNLFRHDASSSEKVAFVGRDLFHAHKRIARELGKMGEVSPDAVKLGDMDFMFQSEYGNVRYTLANNDLPQHYGLGGWGFFLDLKNIESGTYLDYGFMGEYNNIENPAQAIQLRRDAFVGSIWMAPRFEATHGIIRGAPTSLNVERSELIG